MKNHLTGLFAAAAFALVGSAAVAADLGGWPVANAAAPTAPLVSPARGFSWTGAYVGANVGYGWGDLESRFGSYFGEATDAIPTILKDDFNGFSGGGQAGFNWQSGLLVFGVEGDINYLDGKKTRTFVGSDTDGGIDLVGTTTVQSGLTWLGTARGRLGYAADRFFVYGTGGLAFGGIKNRVTSSVTQSVGAVSITDDFYGSNSDTRVGWTLGVGTEYAITSNLTGKLEYLYYDLGQSKYDVTNLDAAVAATGPAGWVRSKNEGSLVRAGVNFKW